MAKQHKYPKTRKARNPYGKWCRIIKTVGKEKLEEIFGRQGMYLASREISALMGEEVTPWITRYIRHQLQCRGYINAER